METQESVGAPSSPPLPFGRISHRHPILTSGQEIVFQGQLTSIDSMAGTKLWAGDPGEEESQLVSNPAQNQRGFASSGGFISHCKRDLPRVALSLEISHYLVPGRVPVPSPVPGRNFLCSVSQKHW